MQKKHELYNDELLNETYLKLKQQEDEDAKVFKKEYTSLIKSMNDNLLFIKSTGKKIENGIKLAEDLLSKTDLKIEFK